MPITDQRRLDLMEKNNQDSYGKVIVDMAKKVMDVLDNDPTPLENGYYPDPHTSHTIITQVNRDSGEDGITGIMAAYMVQIVYSCHSRGKEFVDSYNNKIGKKDDV